MLSTLIIPAAIATFALAALILPTLADLGYSAAHRTVWDLGSQFLRLGVLSVTVGLACAARPSALSTASHLALGLLCSIMALIGLLLPFGAVAAFLVGAPPLGLIGWTLGLSLQVGVIYALTTAFRPVLPAPTTAVLGFALVALGHIPGLIRGLHGLDPIPTPLWLLQASLPDLFRLHLQDTLIHGDPAPWPGLIAYALCWSGAGLALAWALNPRGPS